MKKATAIIVVLVLLLSVFSITASAEDTREYCIKVKTADETDASTYGKVYLIIYGDKGNSGQLDLDDENNNFQTDGTDTFYVTAPDVGEIKYIKLTLADSNADNWCCDWIDIDGVLFELNGYWFSSALDTFIDYSPDVPGDEIDRRHYEIFGPGKQTTVDITVKTDEQSNSGTDGNVFIRLYSSTGATVVYELMSNGNDFETGDLYTYSFYMMDFEQIEKIDVWMVTSLLDSWCLSYIKIGDTIFNANGRWFSDNDGVTLTPSDDVVYTIKIDTADEFMAGTDSDIYVKFISDDAETDWALLDKNDNNDFEQGDSDSYLILSKDIGKVSKIKLKNDGSDEWKIARVQFQGVTYHMKSVALEESELEIDVDYSGSTDVGSVIGGGNTVVIIIIAAAALIVCAGLVIFIKRKKKNNVKQ